MTPDRFPTPSRRGRPAPPADPLAALDVAAFVDCVRELRAAQLADAAAGGDFATRDTRSLARHLDGWLLDLGRPPAVAVVWPAGGEPAGFAGDDPDDDVY